MSKLPEITAEILTRRLIEALPEPAALLDIHGRVYLANSAFKKAFAIEQAELSGGELETVLTPDSSAWIFLVDRLENAQYSKDPLKFDLKFEQQGQAVRLRLELEGLTRPGIDAEWFLLFVRGNGASSETQPNAVSDVEFARRYAEIKQCPPALVVLVEKALGDFIARINNVLKSRDLRLLASRLHGIKGTTMMVGLKSIAGRVHDLESELGEPHAQAIFQEGGYDQKIKELTDDLAETRRMFGVVHNGKNPESTHGASEEVHNSIQRLFTKYDQLISAKPNWGARIAAERIDWAIRKAHRTPLKEVRDFFSNQIQTAAETAGKKVEVDWQSDAMPIDEDSRKVLVEIFTHLATNTVVHGLEDAETRRASGKSGVGHVRVNIRYDGTVIEGTVRDDGRGIDTQAVKERAAEKAVRSTEQLAAMSDDELCGLIFEPGFSTRKEVDHLSGRGVGLDAVRTVLQKNDGDVRVHSEKGKGSEFAFFFRPSTNRVSLKKLLTYKAIHNELLGAIDYQAEHERLPISFDPRIENQSSIETGLVYADDVRLMTALSGILGGLAAKSACEVKMRVDSQGSVELLVTRRALEKETELPEQYEILQESFALWLKINGGAVIENPDGSVSVLIGGVIQTAALPVLEVQASNDLAVDDYASVLKAIQVAGGSMGFQVVKEAASGGSPAKLVLLAAYANYQEKPGEIAVRYQQHPAEIKSLLISAMERVLKAA